VARTGRAYRRIIVQFGGMATIRVTTRTHLFAFKSCAIQQTTHIVKLGFHSGPRTLLPLKRWRAGPQPNTAPALATRAVRQEIKIPSFPSSFGFSVPSTSMRSIDGSCVNSLGAFAPSACAMAR
jgi:hypothetical protein